jgi:type IV pilus assembly protein PilB
VEEKRLGEILVEDGRASAEDVKRALDLQAQVGGRVGRLLVAMGIVAEEVLVEALSRQLRIPKVSLRGRTAGPGLTALVPYDLARRHTLLPVALSRNGDTEVLYVATADPTDKAGIEQVSAACGREVVPVLAPYDELTAALERSYRAADGQRDEGAGPLQVLRGTTAEASPGGATDPLLTAVIRLLLRKGMITEAELLEELRRK